MAGDASAHQAASASREQNSQQRAVRTRRTSADPQRAQQGTTAADAAAPAALASLSTLQHLADASPQVAQLRRLQALAAGRSAPVAQLASGPEEEELVQGKFASAELPPQRQQAPRAYNTGLPDQLKSGIESLSGLSLDDVRVHYNSSQPAQLNALAYAQGRDIHLAPGQEQHLPHEAWHVVQQAQGRVRPTTQMQDGVSVNDAVSLESEADVMGSRALQKTAPVASTVSASTVVQARFFGDTADQEGEVTKDAFLAELKDTLEKIADKELAAIRQTSADCPYLARWFGHYQGKDSAYIQKAIARYAPDTGGAQDIHQYIDLLAARVRQGLKEHVATGTTDAVPAELMEEKHAPEDFVHIANQETAQLGKLCGGGDNEGGQQGVQAPPPVDFEGKYETATPIDNKAYMNVRHFTDTDGISKIIKHCSVHEIVCYQKMSGKPNFPICYGGGNGYVLIEFIGNYPEPAPTADAGNVTRNLAQAANLCKAMAEQGIAHTDLDNNILFHKGALVVIDFGAIDFNEMTDKLATNKSFIYRFCTLAQKNEFNNLF